MLKNYIPVEAKGTDNKKTWYIDVSNLSLGNLLLLQKELGGTERSIDSEIIVEGIIYSSIGPSRMSYGLTPNTMRKEAKRNLKIKKKIMKYNKERINDDKY